MQIQINLRTSPKHIRHVQLYNYILELLQLDSECSICSQMKWHCPISHPTEKKFEKNCNKCSMFLMKKLDSLFGLGRIAITDKPLSKEAEKLYNLIVLYIKELNTENDCFLCKDLGWNTDCPSLKYDFSENFEKLSKTEQDEILEKLEIKCRNHIKNKFVETFNQTKFE